MLLYYYYPPPAGLFSLVLLLNQWWSQPLRFHVSDCNAFRIMCHVPSVAVFCSESIEYFPGKASKFFFKPFTILVAAVITAIIIHFMSHISCVSVYKLLYYTSCSAFAWHFCPLLLPHLSVCMFFLLLLLLLLY